MSKIPRWTMLLAAGAALALPLAAPAGGFQLSEQRAKSTVHANAGPATTHARSTQAMPAGLRPALYGALAKDAGPAYDINEKGCATLSKQKLTACFKRGGVRFSGAGSPLALHLAAWGRGDKLTAVQAVKPVIRGNQARYVHGNLTEWWRVLPMGFEQGFTIAKRPGGKGELTLALAESQQNVTASVPRHSREGGNPVNANSSSTSAVAGTTTGNGNTLAWGKLRYGDLVVTDAKGKVVPATLKHESNRILIVVNDSHVAYPLTVDPLVWLEQKVTASDGTTYDALGASVAVSGATALVGAPGATVNGNGGQGVVYVFSESGGAWTQKAKLTASDGAQGDEFGTAVVLDRSTALVGAPFATVNGNVAQGAAYVFSKSGGIWTQQAELTASDGEAFDKFGYSVAVSGTTALVGALFATVNSHSEQGAAYVFRESGGSWTQIFKLIASDGAAYNNFGWSVALDGTVALIGAPQANTYQGAAYVFSDSSGNWTQMAKLTASDGAFDEGFGKTVDLDGTTALVGADNATVNDNNGQGAAYVFNESGVSWTQTAKLTASDGVAFGFFGYSVVLDGTTALVGAFCGTFDPATGTCGPGAAYLFDESGGNWTQTQELTASDGVADAQFGSSVALSGAITLIGAPNAVVNDHAYQGAAYFHDQSDLGLAVSAPETVDRGQQYVSQTIATNNASAASPAVTATIAVPAAASFVSATASQGSCSETSGVVTCDFGAIDGNAGTATANVTLKATGNVGDTIDNTAGIAKATPPLSASAPTQITTGGGCPEGYTEYDGHLNAGKLAMLPLYQAPAGKENAILAAPRGFQLYVRFQNAHGQQTYRIPGNEVHRRTPAGTFTWAAKAGGTGGAYTFCLLHP